MAGEDTHPCGVCSKSCVSAHKCLKCKKPDHIFCGIESEEEEGYGQSVCVLNVIQKVKWTNLFYILLFISVN